MSKTVVRKNESLDDALRRFKRAVTKAGTLQETRKREFYEKPSVKRKRKSEAARKRKNLIRNERLEKSSPFLLILFENQIQTTSTSPCRTKYSLRLVS